MEEFGNALVWRRASHGIKRWSGPVKCMEEFKFFATFEAAKRHCEAELKEAELPQK